MTLDKWLGLQVRGRGVCDLAGLQRLPPDGLSEIWWTESALVDDHQLQNLGHLTGLKELSLYAQLLTDKGVQLLGGLVGLETLDIASARWDPMGAVTRRSPNPPDDRSALAVSQLENLRYLGVRGWNLTRPGVASLSRLRNLETLDLSDTPISDLHIAALATLPRLTRLFLRNTPLTDAAVDALVHFPSLGFLDVTGTQMTSEWQRAMPSVKSAGTLRPGDTLGVLPRLDAIRIAAGAVPFR